MTQAQFSKSFLAQIADRTRRGLVQYRRAALVPLVVLVAGCSFPQAPNQWNDFANIEVEASRLAYLVNRAAEGDAHSFDELSRSSAALDRAVASVERVRQTNGEPWLPKNAWTDLHKSIQIVLDARDQILGGFESSAKAAAYYESAEQVLSDLAKQTSESESSAARVYIMMNGVVMLERMSINSSRFMKTGKDVQRSGDRLARDAANLGLTLGALRDGSDELGIKAESDVARRTALESAMHECESASVHIGTMLNATGMLEQVFQVSSRIQGQAGIVADSARAARAAASKQSG